LKSIILAAGEGKRLRPLTNHTPKCMVEFFGKSLLERQIEIMKSCGINDIIVVTGYKSNKINIPGIIFEENTNYENTNMVETLFCAKNHFEGEIIISYADIIYEKQVLKKLIDSSNNISIIIDKNWKNYWEKRFVNPLSDAETLKIGPKGNISEIGQKAKNIAEIEGQYIGLMKFNSEGTEIIKNFYEKSKKQSQNGKNSLNTKIPFEKSYMTDLLQGLIKESFPLNPVFINGGWIELDSIEDYNLYKKLSEQNRLKELINLEN
tara:strand:+ start:4976 stop:5767 length:792 start_codon:yes stop_codon:yes gene_type:complete